MNAAYVIAAPETMSAAANDLSIIGSDLGHAHTAATQATVALTPAAADEVSVGIAHLFSRYAEDFHALAGRAAGFHEQFVHGLTAGAASYGSAEAINVSYLLWLVQNAGLYATIQALSEMLRSNSIVGGLFQLLDYVLAPIRAVLGASLFLLFLAAGGVLQILSGFFGQFGL